MVREIIANRPTLVLVGPTAVGKSALAITLAERLPGGGVCISADSMQVYRGLDIGTAKPTAGERARVPHELIDVAEPAEAAFTVDRWLRLAREAEARARAAGRWPILVGGTNLYVKAFVEGLFEGPPADPALRATLEALSPEGLRAELERVDPEAARRIHRNDVRRSVRALEVHRATGRTISSLQTQWDRGEGDRRCTLRLIGLESSVPATNARINARVHAMMKAGFLDEVRRLHAGGRLGPGAAEALGYRELIGHLEGRSSLEEAVEETKIASRRLGKQQRTWLRRFRVWTAPGGLLRGRWFDAEDSGLSEAVLEWVLAEAM